MFVFHAGTVMDLLRKYRPESHAMISRIQDAWETERQADVLNEVYPELPKISVDYALMEPASEDPAVSICGVRMGVDWLDVGSWPSFGETLTPDADGNRLSGGGLALHESRDNLVVSSSDSHTIALLGCSDMIVVHTPGATLVMPRRHAQDVKALHATLPDELK